MLCSSSGETSITQIVKRNDHSAPFMSCAPIDTPYAQSIKSVFLFDYQPYLLRHSSTPQLFQSYRPQLLLCIKALLKQQHIQLQFACLRTPSSIVLTLLLNADLRAASQSYKATLLITANPLNSRSLPLVKIRGSHPQRDQASPRTTQ